MEPQGGGDDASPLGLDQAHEPLQRRKSDATATKRRRNRQQLDMPKPRTLSPPNPYRMIDRAHPTKKLISGDPALRPFTKHERENIQAYNLGRAECKKWYIQCTDATDSETKRPHITTTVLDKVVEAVRRGLLDNPRAQGYLPLKEQDANSYVKDGRGRKPLTKEDPASNITTLRLSFERDRRMAWQALKICPVFTESPLDEKQSVALATVSIFNERFRLALWQTYQIVSTNLEKQYSLKRDNFLKQDMRLKVDECYVGRTWPLKEAMENNSLGVGKTRVKSRQKVVDNSGTGETRVKSKQKVDALSSIGLQIESHAEAFGATSVKIEEGDLVSPFSLKRKLLDDTEETDIARKRAHI